MKSEQTLSNAFALLGYPYDVTIFERWLRFKFLPELQEIAFCTRKDQMEFARMLVGSQQANDVLVTACTGKLLQDVDFFFEGFPICVHLLLDCITWIIFPTRVIWEVVMVLVDVHHEDPSITSYDLGVVLSCLIQGDKWQNMPVAKHVMLDVAASIMLEISC